MRIKDEIFGELTYNDLWIGSSDIIIFEKKQDVILTIYSEEDKDLTDNQKQAFIQFKIHLSKIIQELEYRIFEYYQEIYNDYRAMESNDAQRDKIAPHISSVKELSKLITVTHLHLTYDFGDNIRRIGILCECTWEKEHGLGISIQNEKVVEIGFQDIVL